MIAAHEESHEPLICRVPPKHRLPSIAGSPKAVSGRQGLRSGSKQSHPDNRWIRRGLPISGELLSETGASEWCSARHASGQTSPRARVSVVTI